MKTRIMILGVITLLFTTSSCRTTKTDVGNFRETQADTYTYGKGKQVWLFWGFLPVSRTKVNTPSHGNCQVITRINFWDFVISGVTGGIVSTETIKVKAKRENNNNTSQGAGSQINVNVNQNTNQNVNQNTNQNQ